MKTDTAIKIDGMKALRDKLGLVDAEKFITLIRREPFDYTEWRRELWKDKTIDDLISMSSESLPPSSY